MVDKNGRISRKFNIIKNNLRPLNPEFGPVLVWLFKFLVFLFIKISYCIKTISNLL